MNPNVRFWHKADVPFAMIDVRFRGKSGRRLPLPATLVSRGIRRLFVVRDQ
jgi:hypothetical protein